MEGVVDGEYGHLLVPIVDMILDYFIPFSEATRPLYCMILFNLVASTHLLMQGLNNYIMLIYGWHSTLQIHSADSVIMLDKISGRPCGFGFITFADLEVADKVLQEDHVIDGRAVEVKRTIPGEDMHGRGVSRTRKVFVGGLPLSLNEDDLREYFSPYGNIAEHQIMLDHKTGRSKGFGFVTFETEVAVEKIFSDGRMHELGGKQIKKTEPKRSGFDASSDGRFRCGGSSSRSSGHFAGGQEGFGGGYGADVLAYERQIAMSTMGAAGIHPLLHLQDQQHHLNNYSAVMSSDKCQQHVLVEEKCSARIFTLKA
ncbi:hypothetical protein ACS0TY_016222 [Phlomoides rotata]